MIYHTKYNPAFEYADHEGCSMRVNEYADVNIVNIAYNRIVRWRVEANLEEDKSIFMLSEFVWYE